MRLVFLGTPEFAVPSLKRLLAQPDFAVEAAVTQPDKRRGRGNRMDPSPVKQLALAAGCPVWQPQRIKRDQPTLEALAALQADAFVVVAYGQILSPQILAMPRLGCINGHGSLLPAYRGAAPIQWRLYHGDTETGMTTMLMDAGMDTGAMLLKSTLPIGLLDNSCDLAAALADQCADLLVETLRRLAAGTLTPQPQDETLATYAPLIQKNDYDLDWTRAALALHNQVRGFYPHCQTMLRQKELKVTATLPLGEAYWPRLPAEWDALRQLVERLPIPEAGVVPGTVVALLKGCGPVVQTGDGLLLLRQVKPSGKQAQSGADLMNGSRLEVGERLG